MRLLIALLVCPALWAVGNVCTITGYTGTLSASGGLWTNGTGGAGGCNAASYIPGDGDYINIAGANVDLTIDTTWGSVAGGGLKGIRLGATNQTVTIRTTCAAANPVSLIFGSTGDNPIGAGSFAAPSNPLTDATTTMYGLWNHTATVDLRCSTAPAVIAPTVTYGNPTQFSVASAPATGVGITVVGATACLALDGVHLVTNTGASSFTVPVDSSACSTAFNGVVNVNPLTISAANPANPTYVAITGNVTARNATTYLQYAAVRNGGSSVGSASQPLDGALTMIMGGTTGGVLSADVRNCYFDHGLRAARLGSNTDYQQLTWIGNTTRHMDAQYRIYVNSTAGTAGPPVLTITDNTDLEPQYAGAGVYLYTAYHGSGHVVARNATRSTSTSHMGMWNNNAITAGTGGHTATDDLCAFTPSAQPITAAICYKNVGAATTVGLNDTTTVISGLTSENGATAYVYQNRATTGNVTTVRDSWMTAGSGVGHGSAVIGTGSTVTFTRNVVMVVSGIAGLTTGFYHYSGGTMIADRNTMYLPTGLAVQPTNSYGFVYGQATDALPNNKGRGNLISGWHRCYLDRQGTAEVSANTYAVDVPWGAGMHHNVSFGCSARSYCSTRDCSVTPNTYVSGTGWWDGVNAHPHAAYGDVDGENPRFLDPTRVSIAQCDSALLGGPGTFDSFFAELSRRSGFGGPRQYSGNLIRSCNTWLRSGLAATNLALKRKGHSGTDYVDPGAVDIAVYNTPGGVVF